MEILYLALAAGILALLAGEGLIDGSGVTRAH